MLSVFRQVRGNLIRAFAYACALVMLLILPLAFHDGFFDINRFKVKLVLYTIPTLSAFTAVALLRNLHAGGKIAVARELRSVLGAMMLFFLACILSSAAQGFSQETLIGSDGRYCGLFFLLCCGCVCFILILGMPDSRISVGLMLGAAALCAALGIVNACGYDPLGFYSRIQKKQISAFLSTIGNIDFFGAYMAMAFPIAASVFVHARKRAHAAIHAFLVVCMACGVAASRSDSALAALQLSCLFLTALSSDCWKQFIRALLVWAAAWAALPMMGFLLLHGKWEIGYSGLFRLLSGTNAAHFLAAIFFAAALICRKLAMLGMKPPGSKRLIKAAIVLLLVMAAVYAGVLIYFTAINPDADLGEAETFLRFNDHWGTRRGFVYRCAIEAFSEFSMKEKLFGGGVDCAKRILTPYFDNDAMLRYGTFNDVHSQPLQFLLTTGVLGAGAFAAVYILLLRACFQRVSGDAVLTGVFCSLCGYASIALLGVTQPVIIASYFSMAALAAAHINQFDVKGRG